MKINKTGKELFCTSCKKTIGYWLIDFYATPLLFCSKQCFGEALIKTPEEELILETIAPQEESSEKFSITKRQYEILELVERGLKNQEIAKALYITSRTVESHISSLLLQLNCDTRGKLVNFIKENKEAIFIRTRYNMTLNGKRKEHGEKLKVLSELG